MLLSCLTGLQTDDVMADLDISVESQDRPDGLVHRLHVLGIESTRELPGT